jgi:serine/threonine protein kinase
MIRAGRTTHAMSEHCSLCQVVEAGPYCPRHGMVHRPFSIGGRYDVEELISTSAGVFVFGAQDRTAGRPVAVKVLRSQGAGSAPPGRSEVQQRFLRQAAALSKLTHEHLLGVVDFGWDEALGVTYLVMDRLSGETAAALVRRTGPLRWQQVVPLLVQICRALRAAHERGITDGGLTVQKVFVVHGADRQVVKLCDFGFTSGTPGASADPRDDVHGLGMIAYELLTGQPPPAGGRANGARREDAIGVNEQFPALAVPDMLDALLRACRSHNPMSRPGLEEIEATLLNPMLRPSREEIEVSLLPVEGGREVQDGATLPAVTRTDMVAVPEMIGSYRVVRVLGAGGTGRVYLGQHPVIGTKVAIKVLFPEIARSTETVERFIQEAQASSQIGSPHIPRYFDFGTTADGLPYAMMEYFDGETLGARLARVGTMSVAETTQILEQVANALLMAHEAGLIHRDLKPENILLVKPDPKATRPGSERAASTTSGPVKSAIDVKVLDFGIAKMVGKRSATRTQTGYFLGTPFYCAPEQVFGHEVDARTDVYSLGATAFEMLTGSPPFVGEVPEILSSKATAEPPDLVAAGVPAAVAHTIRRMLAREPARRAPSMAWVLEEMATWSRPDGAGAAGPEPVEVGSGTPRIEREPPAVDPDDTTLFARADSAGVDETSGDAAATNEELEPDALLDEPPRRSRWVITGGVLTAVATVALAGVLWLRYTTPVAPPPHEAPEPPAGGAAAQIVAPPPVAPVPPAQGSDTPAGLAGSAALAGETSGSNAPAAVPGAEATAHLEGSAHPPGASPNDAGTPAGTAVAHPPGKKPPGKKPPGKKPPPGEKPPPGDPNGVLIVDPFAPRGK